MVKWSEDKNKYFKEYYKNHKKKYKSYVKKYQTSEKGKKKIKEYIKEYYQKPEKIKHRREYHRKRYNSDESYRLKNHFSFCFRRVLNKYHQTGKFNFDEYSRMAYLQLGVDFKKIIKHLEPLPKNFKDYHITHIIPLAKFDFTKKEDIKKAWSPKNVKLKLVGKNKK